ncbi:MAG: non-heme iron oxygenase ferredoxin subunit [Dehalococcoidia bacterium]
MTKARVADVSLVREGEVRVVTCPGGRRIALSNIGGQLYAIDDVCSHDEGPLGEGTLLGDRVICPRHGASFDPRTGKALTLPAVRDVATYEVTVEGSDVYIDCGGEA